MKSAEVTLLSVLSLLSLSAAAQDTLADANELYAKNHFSVGVSSGYSRSYNEQTFGVDQTANYHTIPLGLNFKCGLNLNAGYGFELGAGFGMQTTRNELALFSSFSWWSFNSILSADFVCRIPMDERRTLKLKAGVGLWSFGKGSYGAGSSYSVSPDSNAIPEYNSQGELAYKGSKPAFRAGLGLIRQLSNHDLLTVEIGVDLMMQPMFEGTYTVQQNGTTTGKGNIRNSLTTFNLGLNYTFTHVNKEHKLQRHVARGATGKEARREFRAERRKLSPDSWRVGLAAGMFAATTEVLSDPGGYFVNQWSPSFQPQVTIEKGIARNFFAETVFNTTKYGFSERGKGMDFWTGSSAFRDFQLLLGGGYRVIGPRNYRYIDISAGIGLHGNFEEKMINGWGNSTMGYSTSTGDINVFEGSYVKNYVKNYFVTAYFSFSKDFQVTKNLCITMAFRQQYGFTAAALEYQTYNANGSGWYDATLGLRGRGSAYTIGLKYTL